jgi:hypothetical protein
MKQPSRIGLQVETASARLFALKYWKSGEELLIGIDGFPLGWGRRVQGRVKNFYPRGLRWL